MSHRETVEAIYQAVFRGDMPAILEHLAEDVRWESWQYANSSQEAGVPTMVRRDGRDAVGGFFAALGQFPKLDMDLGEIMAGPTQVSVDFTVHARTPNGREFDDEEIHLWSFNDEGKVSRLRHYTDTAKHIAAWAE
jgi:ketosteroid isomerase-like protein